MVNKHGLAQAQKGQQAEIKTQLNSQKVIIKDGKIILNPEGIGKQEQERLRKKYQAIREKGKQEQTEKQAEQEGQTGGSQAERQLEAAFEGKEANM